MSCFITCKRIPHKFSNLDNRYNRLDVFKYVLKTYEKINFEHVVSIIFLYFYKN